MGFPARAASRSSQSMRRQARRRAMARATALLPGAMKPVRISFGAMTARTRSEVAHLFQVAPIIVGDFSERIAAEFFQKRVRELEGDDGLGDYGGGRDRTNVGAV